MCLLFCTADAYGDILDYKSSRKFHGKVAIDDLCKGSLRKVVTDTILTADVRMRVK